VAALFLVPLAGFVGCDNSGPSNFLSGSVTLEGKPVAGNVTLFGSNGKQIEVAIAPDGTYYVPEPPPGQAKFAIKPMLGITPGAGAPPVSKEMKGAATDLGGKDKTMGMGVSPPAKYASVETSGLTCEIKAGKNKFDMPLTP